MFHQGWVGGCYFKTQPSQHVIYWFRTRKMLYHRFHPAEINQCLSGLFCRQLLPTTGRPARRRSQWPSERILYFFSLEKEPILLHLPCLSMSHPMSLHVSSYLIISHNASLSRKAPGESYTAQAKAKVRDLNVYVEVSRNAYMKLDEIKKSNHPILDSSDVFCVQGD